jgi:hypothetical protein
VGNALIAQEANRIFLLGIGYGIFVISPVKSIHIRSWKILDEINPDVKRYLN